MGGTCSFHFLEAIRCIKKAVSQALHLLKECHGLSPATTKYHTHPPKPSVVGWGRGEIG